MTSFPDELQRALGTQYRIDRELGGGGMSRVFVAEETALGRMVVVKLLPPEMAAAVSAERFRREIQTVARLQHPHIVTVLSAGSADGLLFYTMPFVDGRSLRDRLASDGPLPVDAVVGIAREIAGALAYAHGQGLVHRDIKPENVLLSQGHALVTDFGIAKALSQTAPATSTSEPAVTTGGALTGMGMSIGTPMYMAPEQGVGDPDTDHRADLYSLGVMLYELLAGTTPFAGRSAHQLLRAHMMETPPSLAERRPDVPPALEVLVMQCLAKKPEDRPASGDEIVRALRTLEQSSRTRATPRVAQEPAVTVSGKRARYVWGSMALVALVAIASIGYFLNTRFGIGAALLGGTARSAAANDHDRVTVTTFANETGDPALDPVGRIAADWLTTALAGTGLVKVLDARAALGAAGAGSDAANAVRTARGLGAGTVVTGSYYRRGDSLQFDVKLIDAATSEVLQVLESVSGPVSDPTATIDLLRQRTLGALASRFNPMLKELSRLASRPPSYPAYQQMVAGMDDFFAGRLQDATVRFTRASQIDTANVQARTWLLESLENTGQLALADSVARTLEERRDRLSPLEQAQLDEYVSSIRAMPSANLAATFRMHALAPNGQWRATLARKLMIANRWQEALDTLRAAPADVGLFKDKAYPFEQQRQLLHRLGRHEEEVGVAREIVRKFGVPRLEFDMARTYAALGQTDSLRAAATRVSAVVPGDGAPVRTLLRSLSDELRWHGHDAEARALMASVLSEYERMPPDSLSLPAVARGRAETLSRLGRWEDAMRAIGTAANDTSLGARLSLAVGLAHTGDPAPAVRVDAELAALPPHPYRPGNMLVQRARLAAARGDRAAAAGFLRAAQAKGFVLFDGVHANYEFEGLRGDPAFEALFGPGA